jgi:hypothetical protein
MASKDIGLRFERLLFASAPLTLVAFFVLGIALATTSDDENSKAICFSAYAKEITARPAVLQRTWREALPVTRDSYWGAEYRYLLMMALIQTRPSSCYAVLSTELEKRYREPPEKISEKLEIEARESVKRPTILKVIELPDTASFELLGNKVKVELTVLARAAQFVLAPILILWLGSIYSTRYRETVLIANAKSIDQIFPHIVNQYPVGKIAEPLKRSFFAPYARTFAAGVYAVTRIGLLLLFVAPPVAAYLYSLYLLRIEEWEIFFGVFGIVVCIFTFMALLIELYPWHAKKIFPFPANWHPK